MAIHVTRCPHCQTSFRVRDEHLSAARGMVRCGSCLQVFKASEHFTTDMKAAEPQKPTLKVVPKPTSKPAVATAVSGHAFDDIHDHIDNKSTHERMSDDPLSDFNIRAPESRPRPSPRIDLDFSDEFLSLSNIDKNSFSFTNHEKAGKQAVDDEDWANALLDDDIDEFKNTSSKKRGSPSSLDEFVYDRPPPEDDDFAGFFDDELDIEGDHSITKFTLGKDNLNKHSFEIAAPTAKVSHLHHEPLRFEKQQHRSRNIAWGWIVGIVCMSFIALAQTLYFNFDQWSRSPQWRPMYAQLCSVFACQLPKIQNVSSMTTQHLIVRAHPTLQRALMVDTLLLNKADYDQPFPDIVLVFRDLNDRVVANRRFVPAQYLSGELAGQFDMPVRTPVHIALEIADPGPEAVSYAINLVANQ